MTPAQDNLIAVLQTIYRWRKAIRNVCILALAVSIAGSLTLNDYYKATTIFYPASPQLSNPELLFGYTGQVTEYFGSDRDLDRLAEIANSGELVDFMVSTFHLYAHYDIDSTQKKGPYKVRKQFRKLYSAQKNKYDAVEISVEDTDPKLAADMANAARQKINQIAQRLTKNSQQQLLAAFEDNISRKKQELEILADSLKLTQDKYGLVNASIQGDYMAKQLAESKSEIVKGRARLEVLEKDANVPRDTIAFIKAEVRAYEKQLEDLRVPDRGKGELTVKQYNDILPTISILTDLHYQARKQLSYDLERYNQIKAAFNTDIPALHLVEAAEAPLVKSRPRRSVIVIASLAAALVFSILGALLFDAYKDLNWQTITANAD